MEIRNYCLWVFLILANIAIGQNQVDLSDILKLAEEKTLGVKLAASAKMQSEISLDYFKTGLKPGVSIAAELPNYTNTSSAITQPDGTIAFQKIEQNNSSISLGVDQNFAATGGRIFLNTDLQRFDDFSGKSTLYNGIPLRLGFVQPLFGFNAMKWERKILEANINENINSYNIAVEDAKLIATQLYFDVLVAAADRNIASTNKIVNSELLAITEERYEIGKTAQEELLQLQARLKLATLQETQSIYAEQNAIAILYSYLGVTDIPEDLTLTIPERKPTIVLDAEALIAAAFKNRTLVKTFERMALEMDRNLAQTKADHGIQANLFASMGFARGADQISEIYSDPFIEQQVSFSLAMPILDWGRRSAAIKLANLQMQDLQNQFEQDKVDFKNEIQQRIFLFNRLQTEINLLKDIQDIAEQRFEISNKRYILGNISLTDLTIAQTEKDQAQRNYIQGLRSYWTTYFDLNKLTGMKIN